MGDDESDDRVEPALPSATELGLSEGEYERILEDVQARHGIRLTPSAPAPPPRSTPRVLLATVCVVVAALVVLPQLRPHHEPAPVYRFLDTYQGQPVAYSSCRLIQVAVYPAGGPPDAEALVREAVARVRTASGLDIQVVGSFGGHAPNWNFEAAPYTAGDPVSVSWQDEAAIADMKSDVAGLGGSPSLTSPNGTPYRVAGTIALSRDYYALLAQRDDHGEELAVLLHEFGHVLGLDHVDSPRELMYDGNNSRTAYGPGDLEGLRRLGHGPCV